MLVIRTRWWTLGHTHLHTPTCTALTPPHPSPPLPLPAAFTAPIKCLSLEEVGWDPLLLFHFSTAIEPRSLGGWTTPQSPLRLMGTFAGTSPLAGNCGNKTSCCQRQFPLKFCTWWKIAKLNLWKKTTWLSLAASLEDLHLMKICAKFFVIEDNLDLSSSLPWRFAFDEKFCKICERRQLGSRSQPPLKICSKMVYELGLLLLPEPHRGCMMMIKDGKC